MRPTLKLNRFIIFICTILVLSSCEKTTVPQWPEQTNETKPWTRWWWHGSAVDKTNLTANLDELAEAGFGGVEITPIYDVKGDEDNSISFQSEKWMEMFEFTLQEAQRLGLGVDLANASGWPFGGPWIDAEHACKNVLYKKYHLKTGEQQKEKIEFIQPSLVRAVNKKVDISEVKFPISSNTNLQELALDQVRFEKPLPLQTLMAFNAQGETIDLTDFVNANGVLDWTAPEGSWDLYAVFQGWHGKMVERAGTGGEGNVIDHFSEEATKLFLADFDKTAKNFDLSGLRAFFNDSYEVDDAYGDANWTPLFFQEFEKRRGYDLKTKLSALLGDLDDETNQRVLCDYRETISDLLLEKFTIVWADWAESHNTIVRNQAHGSPAAILDLYEASHIPETEGTNPMRIKMATSAGHTSGKPLIACEAATWLNEHFLSTLADVKQNADNYLRNGVNHIVYHGTPYSPLEEKWPGWMFYAAVQFAPTNTWWKDLKVVNEYIANCQSFMQNSTPDNDILLYFPIYDAWTERDRNILPHFGGSSEELTAEISNELLAQGLSFDYISDRQIRKLNASNGEIQAAGAIYKTILVPACNSIPLQTLRHLFTLAENGATVIFEDEIPTKVPGLKNFQSQQAEIKKLVNELQFETEENHQSASIGNGKIMVSNDIKILLNAIDIYGEELAQQGLWFNRVERADGACYFISNWTQNGVAKWITLQKSGKEAVWFNPMNNTFGKAHTQKTNDGQTQVFLQQKPGETLILQWYSSKVDADDYPLWEQADAKTELTGEWEITFEKGGPALPASFKTDALKSWSLQSEELQKFSGTANYKTNFEILENRTNNYLLDLGEVHESAEVWLNGEKIGTLIGPVFQIILPKELLQAQNTLELKVTNLMANRIIDMDKNQVNYKKFYNINFAAHERENIGADGTFTAANWEPLPSGLLGQVYLIPLTEKE
ncbi:glycosyl hydrolase [uncultured Draconibacterium sp.]|uniref:glycosyl hydrolase n=1 Tax=uncultured Draconibacterium sp. TaxID=1573823 RepID=UPI002AA8CCE2|nr:glycosyl hydrolase [uncultured Draconibacterium sp.]